MSPVAQDVGREKRTALLTIKGVSFTEKKEKKAGVAGLWGGVHRGRRWKREKSALRPGGKVLPTEKDSFPCNVRGSNER